IVPPAPVFGSCAVMPMASSAAAESAAVAFEVQEVVPAFSGPALVLSTVGAVPSEVIPLAMLARYQISEQLADALAPSSWPNALVRAVPPAVIPETEQVPVEPPPADPA